MSYYMPDLSGTNPDYLVANDLYTVFTAAQRIEFGTPIFLDSLVINIVGTTRVPFVQGTDWTIVDATDIDYTEMSRMMNYSPTFSQTLIKSILITSPTPVPYKIACSYQKLYPVTEKISVGEDGQVEFTPGLLVDMLKRLADVELQAAQVPNTVATAPATPKLLPLDPDEENADNVITESHTVNTFGGQNLIQPSCGSFFGDSVAITLPTTNAVLVNGTDYLIIGLDAAKTRGTTNTAGVFNFILLTYPYAGTVNVSCHAYGGAVTMYDMTAVWETVSNINTYLGQSQFITPTSLGSNAVILSLIGRVTTLETNMRNLINSGQPNYSDATGNGTAVVQKIRSNDTSLHWWTIASLYTVAGSAEVVTADRMHLRFQLLNAHVSADVFVNVDTTLAAPFEIDAIAVNQDLGYTPFTAYDTDPVCMPQFRVIYNTSTASPSGILLQIGLKLAAMVETVSIQDLSGTESCWILLPGTATAATASLPMDGMVTLPNTTYTWDPSYTDSVQFIHMMPNKTGYLAWGGALAVAAMTTTPNVLTPLLDGSFNIDDITKVRLQFTETSNTTTVLTVDVPMDCYSDPTMLTGSALVQNAPTDGTSIIMQVTITNRAGVFAISITPDHIPTITNLALRHALVMTE